jgi:S-adenosylmethionine/arginine decarboxylase-like enzyme
MKDLFVPNHLHLLVRGYASNPVKDEASLNLFLRDLVKKVRMVVLAGPTSVYVDDPGNEGMTGTITLATSHASIHIWDQSSPALFQFDLYSCSEFTPEEVINFINERISITKANWIFIDRNSDDMEIIGNGVFNNP